MRQDPTLSAAEEILAAAEMLGSVVEACPDAACLICSDTIPLAA